MGGSNGHAGRAPNHKIDIMFTLNRLLLVDLNDMQISHCHTCSTLT